MKYNKLLAGACIFIIILAGLLVITYHNVKAEDGESNEDVIRKLDEVLKGQKEIAAGIETLKQEIQIVKIRITQNQ